MVWVGLWRFVWVVDKAICGYRVLNSASRDPRIGHWQGGHTATAVVASGASVAPGAAVPWRWWRPPGGDFALKK